MLLRKPTLLLLLMLVCIAPARAQENEKAIHAAVQHFFDALSDADESAIRNAVTADFELLEDEKPLSLDSLVSGAKARKSKNIKRVNRFQFEHLLENPGMAQITYRNFADFSKDGKSKTVEWQERAVFVLREGKWKMAKLNSTRIK